jgi:hypothetical protein
VRVNGSPVCKTTTAKPPCSGARRSWGPSCRLEGAARRRARTRGFAPPAFAGLAFSLVAALYRSVRRASSRPVMEIGAVRLQAGTPASSRIAPSRFMPSMSVVVDRRVALAQPESGVEVLRRGAEV